MLCQTLVQIQLSKTMNTEDEYREVGRVWSYISKEVNPAKYAKV